MNLSDFSEQKNLRVQQLHIWLSSWSPESLVRLRQINESSGSARHVILALAYGICDAKIRQLNRMITGLLLRRMQAERAANEKKVQKINEFMLDLHESIDLLSGVCSKERNKEEVCNRVNPIAGFSV